MDEQQTGPGTEQKDEPRKSLWEPFHKWWERDQNKIYTLLFVAGGYIVGATVGELNARRREDRRWTGVV